MSFIQFESATAKEAERQALREARQKILTDAEAAFIRNRDRKQRAKERGDDRWMLPSVEAKISSSHSSPKRKKKKEKKAKKSKKKRRRSRESSSDGESSGDEAEWVEKDTGIVEKSKSFESSKPLERDEWMNLRDDFLFSSRDEKQQKKQKNDNNDVGTTRTLDLPGQSNRELNPYWKNAGTGLPNTEDAEKRGSKLMDADWLKKSLRRAEQRAMDEGKSLEEIAAERWGSLDAIRLMIREAEKNSMKSNNCGRNWRAHSEKFSLCSKNNVGTYVRENDNKKEHRKDSIKYRENLRSRSKSPERYNGKPLDSDKNRIVYSERRKLGFMKPNERDNSPSSSSRKSTSSLRRWQKTEVKDKIVERKEDARDSKNVRDRNHEKLSQNRSDSEENDGNEQDREETLTQAEMNMLGAKIVKAEIMGDTELAAKLKAKLESSREIRKKKPTILESRRKEAIVILTETNVRGMARPLEARSRYEEPTGGRRKSKKVDTHESGKRVRYFADDDKFTLQDMFHREKGVSSTENDASFVAMASKSTDMDELFEERITREESDAKQDARERSRAIKEHKKLEKSLDNCRLCFDSKNMLKHLIVALGSKVYVSLPPQTSMTEGHCVLASIHHVSCQTQLDEDVWEELENFKKALTKMFMKKNEYPVFFELFTGQRKFPHMKLECIPLPENVGSSAPIYFKKALLECETEWSTNKKVVDLSNKDVRHAIPKGLPYFAVNFGNHGGFAHVIEDEKLFPRNFAQEIIGGIMDLDYSLWRKPRHENFDQQRKKVLDFASSWKSYDFTANNDT